MKCFKQWIKFTTSQKKLKKIFSLSILHYRKRLKKNAIKTLYLKSINSIKIKTNILLALNYNKNMLFKKYHNKWKIQSKYQIITREQNNIAFTHFKYNYNNYYFNKWYQWTILIKKQKDNIEKALIYSIFSKKRKYFTIWIKKIETIIKGELFSYQLS